jgi:hydrogenase expression/formation protein HypC
MCLAIPGEVLEIDAARPEIAKVEVSGVRRLINIGLLDAAPPAVGDWVLIHVGFAMSKIDEAEAAQTLEYLKGMEQAYADELRAMADSAID